MKIRKIYINNFRNLNNIKIKFHQVTNYIIGESNLGKSNLLDLLCIIGNSWSFSDSDFNNKAEAVEILITISIDDDEIGLMGGSCSPDNANLIRIKITQFIEDVRPIAINNDTQETIPYKHLKRLNFTKYDTLRNPSNELKLDNPESTGNILGFFIEKHIENNAISLENKQFEGLLNYLNKYLKKIKAFKDFNINASMTGDTKDILSKMISLIDDNDLPISDTGNGIQFSAMATLNIFRRILKLFKDKSDIFEELSITKNEGNKVLQMILAIDEPEVHLHPYMQRSIINYYKRILANEDNDFLELIKYCFDIDGIEGQLFIVTHSTDALVDDYRSITRFYRDSNEVKTVSGLNFNIDQRLEKHLLMHFPDIKEAFYSKCTIIVEGATEYGAMKSFADIINKSLDDYGICLINADGERSISKIKELLEHFKIPSILIFDKDVQGNNPPSDMEFFTNGICFEMDIVEFLMSKNYTYLKDIIDTYDGKKYGEELQKSYMQKPFEKMGYDFSVWAYSPKKLIDIPFENKQEFKEYHFAVLYKIKGVIIGRIIGEKLIECGDIPDVFRNAITKAVEVTGYAST